MADIDSNLAFVKKVGEPVLAIHRDALAQHIKLGWEETDEEPAPAPKPTLSVPKKSDK